MATQLTGGNFQDAESNPLALGYMTLVLSQDAVTNTNEQVAAGRVIRIPLDSNGNVVTSPAYSVWANDLLSPAGTFYAVTAYTQAGQPVWGPNYQQVLSTSPPFNVGSWIPNNVNTSTGTSGYVLVNPTFSQVVNQPANTDFEVAVNGASLSGSGFILSTSLALLTALASTSATSGTSATFELVGAGSPVQSPASPLSECAFTGDVVTNLTTCLAFQPNLVTSSQSLVYGFIGNTQRVNSMSPIVLVDATDADITLTLPLDVLPPGSDTNAFYPFLFKRLDSSSHTVTLQANSGQSIDGLSSMTISGQYSYITLAYVSVPVGGSGAVPLWTVVGHS